MIERSASSIDTNISFRMSDDLSIFKAETNAICKALETFRANWEDEYYNYILVIYYVLVTT